MSVKHRCAEAIRRVGGTAYLIKNSERLPFIASLQPLGGAAEETGGSIGWGLQRRHALFAPCGEAADSLASGDTVEYLGVQYWVRRVDRAFFQNEAAYIRAVVQPEEGGS